MNAKCQWVLVLALCLVVRASSPFQKRVKTKGSLLKQVETSEGELTKPGSPRKWLSTVFLTFYMDSTYSSLTIYYNYYCISYVRHCWALVDWRHSKCCVIWYEMIWYATTEAVVLDTGPVFNLYQTAGKRACHLRVTAKSTVSRRQDSQNKGNDSYAPHVRRKTQRVKVHHFRSCKQQISYHQRIDATTLAVTTCQDSLFRTLTTWQEKITSGASLIVFLDLAENQTGTLGHIHQQTTF